MDPRDVPAAHSMDTAWFGVDADGNLALFDTAEPGALPEGAAGDSDSEAFEAIREAAGVAEDLWEEDPPSPVFRYEHDPAHWIAGPYVRRHVPERPARIESVPLALRSGIVRLPVRFAADEAIQPAEHVPCDGWGALWLSADGTIARAFPGREAEAEKEWSAADYPGVTFERTPGVPVTPPPARGAPAAASPRTPPPFPSPLPPGEDRSFSDPPDKPWWKFW